MAEAAEAPMLTQLSGADMPIPTELTPTQTAPEQFDSDAQHCQEHPDYDGKDLPSFEDPQPCEDIVEDAVDLGRLDGEGGAGESEREIDAILVHEDIADGEGNHCRSDGEGENGDEEQQIQVTPVHEEFECRICQQSAELDELWAPCRCTGTMKFVHPACLQAWRQRSSGDAVRCGVCLASYEGARELSWAQAGPIYVSTRLGVAFNSIVQPPIRHRGLELALRISEGLAFGKYAFCRAFRLGFWFLLLLLAAACSRPVLLTVSVFHELVMGVDRAVDPIIFPEQPLGALYRFFPAIGGFGHLGVYEATASLAEALADVAQSGRPGGWVTCPTMDDSLSCSSVCGVEEGSSSCSSALAANSSAAAAAMAVAGNASSVGVVGNASKIGSGASTVHTAAGRVACSLASNVTRAAATSDSYIADAAAAMLTAWARVSIADLPKAAAEATAPWLRPFQEVIGRALDQGKAIWRTPASLDDAALGVFLLLLLVHVAFCVLSDHVVESLRRIPSPLEDAMALFQGGVPGPDHAVAFVLLSLPWAAYSGRWLLAAWGILPMAELPFHEHVALHVLLALSVIAMYSLVCDLCEVVHQDFLQWYAAFTLGSHESRSDVERLGRA